MFNRQIMVIIAAMLLCFVTVLSDAAEENIKIGGLAGFIYYNQNKNIAGNTLHPYYDFHPVYLYTKATINERISSLIEVEYEHAPQFTAGGTGAGEIKLERGYIETNISDQINFLFGKFFTNFGPWYEEHWRLIAPTFERTIAFENTYVPNFQMGVKLFGQERLFSDTVNLKYYLWNSMADEVSGTNSRKGGRFDALGAELDSYFKNYRLGVAAYTQTNPSQKNRKEKHYNIFGSTALMKKTVLKTEYTIADFGDGDEGTKYDDAHTFYTGIEYKMLEAWSIYYRYENGNDQKRTGLTGEKAKTNVNAVALTWSPVPGFRIKSEYIVFSFKEKALTNYNKLIVSTGVIF